MKKGLIYIFSLCTLLLSSCTEYDNYDEPESTLTGKVLYEGEQLAFRNSAISFDLFQLGYDKGLSQSIPLHIAQDGTFSAKLFNGEYKLVRNASGPWVDQVKDTLLVTVKGNTIFDVEVKPHFIVNKDTYTVDLANKKVTGTFTISKVAENSNLSNVRMYIGSRVLLDNDIRDAYLKAEPSAVTYGEPLSITMSITDELIKKGYMYVRVGAKAAESGQYIYTQVQKIELK